MTFSRFGLSTVFIWLAAFSLLTYVAISVSFTSATVAAQSNTQIPFDGMSLVYYSETTPILQSEIGASATGWATFNFSSVTPASSIMAVAVNGTVTTKTEQKPVNFTLTVSFPTDQDTLLYLRHGGQQGLTIYAAPADESFQLIPGYNFNLTRTWNYLGQSSATTPIGSFTAYRYHTAQTLSDTVLDFYAYYDVATQVLVYGEVYATKGGFNALIEKITLNQENFQTPASTTQSPQCIIATAAYGSALAPPVQFLREFRDQDVRRTYLGSRFIAAFNAWYYSWATPVAKLESGSGYLRATVRATITPMLGALIVSDMVFNSLRAIGPEFGILVSGLIASALIGLVYLSPLVILAVRLARRKLSTNSLIAVAILGATLSFLGTFTHGSFGIMENLTALFVMEAIIIPPCLLVRNFQSEFIRTD